MSTDLQAILEEFDLDEDDARLLRALEALLERRAARGKDKKSGAFWDHTYKGHAHWLLFRAKALAIIHRNAYVTWGLLDEDPWFRKDAPPEGDGGGMQDPKQWQRAVYARLIKNKPEGPEEFVAFQVRERGTRYVTIRRYLHCAIAKAVGGRKDARRRVRELRLRYRVEGACEWDKRRYGGGGVEESLQLPVVTHGPTVEQQLSEDEMALLQAHPGRGPVMTPGESLTPPVSGVPSPGWPATASRGGGEPSSRRGAGRVLPSVGVCPHCGPPALRMPSGLLEALRPSVDRTPPPSRVRAFFEGASPSWEAVSPPSSCSEGMPAPEVIRRAKGSLRRTFDDNEGGNAVTRPH